VNLSEVYLPLPCMSPPNQVPLETAEICNGIVTVEVRNVFNHCLILHS